MAINWLCNYGVKTDCEDLKFILCDKKTQEAYFLWAKGKKKPVP